MALAPRRSPDGWRDGRLASPVALHLPARTAFSGEAQMQGFAAATGAAQKPIGGPAGRAGDVESSLAKRLRAIPDEFHADARGGYPTQPHSKTGCGVHAATSI